MQRAIEAGALWSSHVTDDQDGRALVSGEGGLGQGGKGTGHGPQWHFRERGMERRRAERHFCRFCGTGGAVICKCWHLETEYSKRRLISFLLPESTEDVEVFSSLRWLCKRRVPQEEQTATATATAKLKSFCHSSPPGYQLSARPQFQ